MVILSLSTFETLISKLPRLGSCHLITACFKPSSTEEFNVKWTLKASIFVAIVSDELRILQQPTMLQHAKILYIEWKEYSPRVLFECMADTCTTWSIRATSSFKFSALDLREHNWWHIQRWLLKSDLRSIKLSKLLSW